MTGRPGTIRGVLAALGVIAGGVLLLYALITVTDAMSRVGPWERDPDISILLPDEEGNLGEEPRRAQPDFANVPAYAYDDPESTDYGVFEIPFEWKAGDPEQALFLSFYRRIEKVELNGEPQAVSVIERQSLLGGYHPVAIALNSAALVEGENIVRVTDPGNARKIMAAAKIVPLEQAQQAEFWGQFFEVHLTIAITGVMAFVAVFCLLMRWPAQERFEIAMLVVLLAVWTVRNAMAFGFLDGLENPGRLFTGYWIGYLLVGAYAAYAVSWARLPNRFVLVPWGIAIAVTLFSLVYWGEGSETTQKAWEYLFAAEIWLIATMGLAAVALVAAAPIFTQRWRPVQAILLIAAGLAIVVDAFDEQFDISIGLFDPQPFVHYATPKAGLLVALGMFGAMIFHQLRARRLSDDLNGVLQSELALRERELEKSYEERAVLAGATAAAAERERIMMDVHDGLGARMLVLEQLAKDGAPPPDKLRDEVAGAVSEVRLIADTLAAPAASFDLLWSSLHHRLAPRLEAAGIASVWTIDPDVRNLEPSAEVAQHLMRIMQEAITNIVRHSGAKNVEFIAAPSGDGIAVHVEDDGDGIDPDRAGGRGLGFMARRAGMLGGTLDIAPTGKGTRLSLTIPEPG